MHYLTAWSTEELKHNFALANEHLQKVFSQYPYPESMEGCPCCVNEDMRESLRQGDLSRYFGKAMTTWGNENDFKHYIPKLFSFVYLERENDDYFILVGKLDYVQEWTREENQAILSWFNAYAQYKCIDHLKRSIAESRRKVQDWLAGTTEELSCDFPFSIFSEEEFTEMIPFLQPELIEKFAELLFVWPLNEMDLIAFASYLVDKYLVFDGEYQIFAERKSAWISKNQNRIEELFWKTDDPRLQKLFSDSLLLELSE